MLELTDSDIKRFWDKVDIKGSDDCWNWKKYITPQGYGQFKQNGEVVGSHRIALQLGHVPQNEGKTFCLHTCKQNRKCCNPNHLYWGNHTDNMRDKVKDGTMPLNGFKKNCIPVNRKLDDDQVREIKKLLSQQKLSQRDIAKQFNVTPGAISSIICGKSWGHIII